MFHVINRAAIVLTFARQENAGFNCYCALRILTCQRSRHSDFCIWARSQQYMPVSPHRIISGTTAAVGPQPSYNPFRILLVSWRLPHSTIAFTTTQSTMHCIAGRLRHALGSMLAALGLGAGPPPSPLAWRACGHPQLPATLALAQQQAQLHTVAAAPGCVTLLKSLAFPSARPDTNMLVPTHLPFCRAVGSEGDMHHRGCS